MRIKSNNPLHDLWWAQRSAAALAGGQVSVHLHSYSRYWRHLFNSPAVRDALGVARDPHYGGKWPSNRLPATSEAVAATVGGITWLLLPKGTGSAHRVKISCPCGQLVPAGRMGSHRCKGRALGVARDPHYAQAAIDRHQAALGLP